MTCIRVPSWGFSRHDAIYYGRRLAFHIGPWLIFIGGDRK